MDQAINNMKEAADKYYAAVAKGAKAEQEIRRMRSLYMSAKQEFYSTERDMLDDSLRA